MSAAALARLHLERADIPPALLDKWEALTNALQAYDSSVVAYSGGVDSSLLSYAAFLALGDRMVAVTMDSTLEAPDTLQMAAEFAEQHRIKHKTIPFDPLKDAALRANPADRCYLCKSHIVHALQDYARQNGFAVVLDGQNEDDRHDYRPGARAVKENGIPSPLADYHMTKAEIRKLAQALGLAVWDKPSSPCLASRIPYGVPITGEALQRIALGEIYLRRHGFQATRVRYHQELARIETAPAQLQAVLDMREDILAYFKEIGFLYVALDLQGYRLGSMNEALT